MDKADKKKLAEVLTGSAELFGRELSPMAMVLYIRALEDLPLEDCVRALGGLCKSGKFFPKPAEVRELVEGPQLSIEDESEVEAGKVFTALARFDPHDDVAFDNPYTLAVIQQGMGGWSAMGRVTEREMPFLRKQFIQLYQAYKRSDIKAYGCVRGDRVLVGRSTPLKIVGDNGKALAVMNYQRPKELTGGKGIEDVLELARTIGSQT